MKLPGTATEEENIYIAMGKLCIQPGQVFLDIGCGSGAVSLAASRYTDRIYRPRHASGGGGDLQGKGSRRATFSRDRLPSSCPSLPEVDRCFIGGTRQIDEFLPLLLEKATPGCVIVADLARIGIASRVADVDERDWAYFRSFFRFISCGATTLAGDIALKPVNPIFMVIGKC